MKPSLSRAAPPIEAPSAAAPSALGGDAPCGRRKVDRLARRPVRFTAAFALGGLLALALPPFDVLPAVLAYSGFVALLLAGEARVRRRWLERALLGAALGLGYHLAGLWWIGRAFLVEAETFGALLPFAVLGLPLLLAPFHALAAALAGLAPPSYAWRAVGFALALSATEWLRGIVLTGFPWNAAGVQVTSLDVLMQGASAVGLPGLAVVSVLLGTAPGALLRPGSRWLAAVAAALALALLAYGAGRLAATGGAAAGAQVAADDTAPRVRIVQPAVPQEEKWMPSLRQRNWQHLLALTAAAGEVDIVVWPETAIPFLYRPPDAASAAVAAALGESRWLIAGAVELDDAAAPGARRAANSILLIDSTGRVRQRYDKNHLVPFGEYVPFAGLARRLGLSRLTQGTDSFRAGTRTLALDVPGAPLAQPSICYEIIFSHPVLANAGWIVNVTNDAWFGDTPGPRQHLRHARLRAVSRGVPVVRAANTGISAMIDADGRLLARLPLGTAGVVDVTLPAARRTVYALVGDAPLFALWTLALAAALRVAWRHPAGAAAPLTRVRRSSRGG